EDLIKFHGGKDKFEQKLDELFNLPSATTGRQQVDITGLIGQYAHGNEPSHHVAYLYNYVGKLQKTKQRIHYILKNFYTNTPDGLIGNEDCGQMSAWFVLSSMGIYSVAPGQIGWQTVEPYFDEIKINYEDGTSETITPKTPKDVLQNIGFGSVPMLIQKEYEQIVPVPYLEFDRISFNSKMQVSIKAMHPSDVIYYSIKDISEDANTGPSEFKKYSKPLTLDRSTKVEAYVKRGEKSSAKIFGKFFKKPNDYSIKIKSNVHPLYTAGGS